MPSSFLMRTIICCIGNLLCQMIKFVQNLVLKPLLGIDRNVEVLDYILSFITRTEFW